MIFIGVLFIIVSLISVFLETRKGFNFLNGLERKKQELADIINDAEQMLQELNRLSDYVVSQIDLKNEELNKNLKKAEEKAGALAINTKISNSAAVTPSIAKTDTRVMETESAYAVNSISAKSSAINYAQLRGLEALKAAYGNKGEAYKNDAAVKKNEKDKIEKDIVKEMEESKEKVIPFKSKYSEVLRLAGEGMESLEIAKKLHMGKGEVELIIGLRK